MTGKSSEAIDRLVFTSQMPNTLRCVADQYRRIPGLQVAALGRTKVEHGYEVALMRCHEVVESRVAPGGQQIEKHRDRANACHTVDPRGLYQHRLGPRLCVAV